MVGWLILLLRFALAAFNSRRNSLLENLALCHELLVLRRTAKLPRLTPLDRAPWAWLGVESVATARTHGEACARQRAQQGRGFVHVDMFLRTTATGDDGRRVCGPRRSLR